MKFILIIAFTTCLINGVFSQKKYLLRVNYFGFEEYAFNTNIQSTLNPTFLDCGCYESPRIQNTKGTYVWCPRPKSIGIDFEKKTLKRFDFGLSMGYFLGGSPYLDVAGSSFKNRHVILSLNGIKQFYENQSNLITMSWIGKTSFRVGKDYYWRQSNINIPESTYPLRKLRDFSISFGVKIDAYLPHNFVFSVESSVTQWLFLYSNILRSGLYQFKPWHQLDLRIGVGYTFDKILKKTPSDFH